MSWSPGFVACTFSVAFILGCYFTFLSTYNLYRFRVITGYGHETIYSQFGYHISALGCLWYRLWLSRVACSHAAIHTIALGFYIYGIRDEYKNDKYFFKRHCGLVFCGTLYLIQYFIGITIELYSFTATSSRVKSLLFGFHAFGGTLTYIVSSYYNSLVYSFIRNEKAIHKYNKRLLRAHEYGIIFTICSVYLLLNPYYEWRKMKSYSILEAESIKKRRRLEMKKRSQD